MPIQGSKLVLAVVSDLFFAVKLSDAAKRSGLTLEFVKERDAVLERSKEKPALMVFDLNFDAVEPVDLITTIKGDPDTKGVKMIGFLSHVQGELKQAAQEAGCDMVMARSAFSTNLFQIFKRYGGVL